MLTVEYLYNQNTLPRIYKEFSRIINIYLYDNKLGVDFYRKVIESYCQML